MLVRQLLRSSVLGAAVLCLSVGVQAQPTGEVGVKTTAPAGGPEQIAAAEAIAGRGPALAGRLSTMLEAARKEKDIMLANCISRKLTEVNAASRTVEQRVKALKAAAQLGDTARQSHEFTVLSVLSEKFNALDSEASQCLGQGAYEPGASAVVTSIVSSNAPTFNAGSVAAPPPPPPSVTVPPPISPVN